MASPWEIYDLLLDYASGSEAVREIIIGLVWTCCEADAVGLAMSPGTPTRTLPWAGTLRGKPVAELAGWIKEFNPYQASVGMAAVNAAINRRHALPESIRLEPGNLAVFEHFLPQIKQQKIVVVGRYPGLDEFVRAHQLDLTVLERQPGLDDLPDAACEYLLSEAEWVFLTASSIANKTFPRLAELSRNAVTVLMGPTTPRLPDLYHFGIDFLAAVEIAGQGQLRQTVAEGGGVRLFDTAVSYYVSALGQGASLAWTKGLITHTANEKGFLTRDMAAWYEQGQTRRYPRYAELETANRSLSRLDSCYKKLWDEGQQ
jgi:uncharacterized protein (DUF4213/DUF364 family)